MKKLFTILAKQRTLMLYIFVITFVSVNAQTPSNTQDENGIVRSIDCPNSTDGDITVSIHIFPKKIKDYNYNFRRIKEIIPEGYTAIVDLAGNSKTKIDAENIKFYWVEEQTTKLDDIVLTYRLQKIKSQLNKKPVITGTYYYVVDSEKKQIQISGDSFCKF